MNLENISGMIIEHLKDRIYELEVNTTNRNFGEQMNSSHLKQAEELPPVDL